MNNEKFNKLTFQPFQTFFSSNRANLVEILSFLNKLRLLLRFLAAMCAWKIASLFNRSWQFEFCVTRSLPEVILRVLYASTPMRSINFPNT